jgi:hypothetical protein
MMVLKPSRAIAYLRGARLAELSLRLSLRHAGQQAGGADHPPGIPPGGA